MALDTRDNDDTTGLRGNAVGKESHRWWGANAQQVGAMLTSAAADIEVSNQMDRFMSYTFARLMTGRSSAGSYGVCMSESSSRFAKATWTAEFNPPSLNVIAECADIFANKIFKNRPWLEWIANRGDFESRMSAKSITEFMDALFEHFSLWEMIELCGIDCMTDGSAFIKVAQGLNKKLELGRCLKEEILLMPDDGGAFGKPKSMIQRLFVDKQDAMARWPKHADALKNAQGCFPGYFKSGLRHSDIVALVEGWRLPLSNGEPGRHVTAIGNVVLQDKPWKRERFPFAKLIFQPLSNSVFGQGLAEILLPLQREINRVSMAIAESERRAAWPRIQYPVASGINPEHFNGPGLIPYAGTTPATVLQGLVTPPELYSERAELERRAKERVGISQNAQAGEKSQGLTSGRAIMAEAQLDDIRHVSLNQRLEDFVKDIGNLVVDECESTDVTLHTTGKSKVSWSDIKLSRERGKLAPFPMSRLPQLPAARFETIENWYLEGTINRSTKMRLQNMPDTQGFMSIYTASEDMIEKTLDMIVKLGKFIPPSPYSDLTKALQMGQARFQYEWTYELPEDRLKLIAIFISAVIDMMPEPPAPAPAMPGIGAIPGMPPALPEMMPNPAAPPVGALPPEMPPEQMPVA